MSVVDLTCLKKGTWTTSLQLSFKPSVMKMREKHGVIKLISICEHNLVYCCKLQQS